MPEIGDVISGTKLGYKVRAKYVYLKCPLCGLERWVRLNSAKKHNFIVYCKENNCQQKYYADLKHKNDLNYWDGSRELKLGMVVSGIKLNYKSRALFVYDECPICHINIWRLKKDIGRLCVDCDAEKKKSIYRGSNNPAWKGGRYIEKDGYTVLCIIPSDKYFPMSLDGKIFEHDYIMAKSLGRLLKEEEVVHHKGIRFPRNSYENRHDNELDNLKIFDTNGDHLKYHAKLNQIDKLVNLLKDIIKEK